VPSFRLALAQIAVGLVNFSFVTAALWQSLAAATGARYTDVVVGYVMGVIAAILSHVPGGLGVIEAAVLFVVPGAGAIGGLVLFRVLYYLVPLLLGIAALGASELLELRSRRLLDRRRRARVERRRLGRVHRRLWWHLTHASPT